MLSLVNKGSVNRCVVSVHGRLNDRGEVVDYAVSKKLKAGGDDKEEAVSLIISTVGPEIKEVFVPSSSFFNKKIVGSGDFNYRFKVNRGRNFGGDICIYFGADADCTLLTKAGQAMWQASADCPTAVLFCRESKVIYATHAGRDCLVSREKLRLGEVTVPEDSVILKILENFPDKDSRQLIEVGIHCGIGAENFLHPINHENPAIAKQNQLLLKSIRYSYRDDWFDLKHILPSNDEYGKISLRHLIRAQCIFGGVLSENVFMDDIDTYSDTEYRVGSGQTNKFWSHCRESMRASGKNLCRNLVLVKAL